MGHPPGLTVWQQRVYDKLDMQDLRTAPATAGEIAARFEVRVDRVRPTLFRLCKLGLIRRIEPKPVAGIKAHTRWQRVD